MDDELLVWALFGLAVGGVGWLLGIVGFFKARDAVRRVQMLEARLRAGPTSFAPPAEAVAPPVENILTPSEPQPDQQPDPETEPVADAAFDDGDAAGPARKPAPAAPKRDLEALLTLRWGVWLGAAALVFAGIFLIRYAVDAGLLNPAVRCVLAGLGGAVLVAGGEAALRRRPPSRGMADQVPAALTAGGLAILFGGAYGAGPLYALVSPLAAFVLMSAVGVGGLALSLRQGPLVAGVGLVGAFATPLLVAGDGSVPGLFVYLLVVTAAALGVVRLTAWAWLGWAAIAAGAFYVLAALPGLGADVAWAPAGFIVVAAALNLGLLPGAALETAVGRRLAWVPFAVLGLCGLLLNLAVDDWAVQTGVLLLALVALVKARLEPRLDRLAWLAALFCLLLLRIMVLPPWHVTGEAVVIEGGVVGLLPGGWAPAEIQPFLWVAVIVAAGFALAGLWQERFAPRPVRWAALTAAVPVLCLGIAFAQVRAFQADGVWAVGAVLLSAGLVGSAALAARSGDQGRAGVHAAGAVAALALGCAMLLAAQWLTLALALFLPGLAWVEGRTGLRALRRVALVVALVVLARLLLNWYVLEYVLGGVPVVNGLLAVYAVPAVAFGVAAVAFRRRGTDLTVAVLQVGSVALTTAFVAAEIHHWAQGGRLDSAALSFLEAALHVDALGVLAVAVLRVARTAQAPVLDRAWRVLAALALLGGAGLLVANPLFFEADVGQQPIFDALLPAYALPAVLAAFLLTQGEVSPPFRRILAAYAVLGGFAWVTLEMRHLFHPEAMAWDAAPVEDAELWAWSGVWLAYGAALLTAGILGRIKALRLAALAIVGLTTAKVFLVDMSGLIGLWRVVSFLGLGLALIGLGAVYRRFVVVEVREDDP